MLTKDKIIETANRDWAEFYQCEASLFSTPGSRMVISERMKGTGRVSIRFIGSHAMISIDEDVREQVEKILAEAPAGLSLGMEHFITYFGNDQIQVDSVTLANLVAEDQIIRPQAPDSRYQLRKLTEADSGKMEKLCSACTEEEVDNAYVETGHDIVLGYFIGDELAAAASTLDWGAFFDVGVITHQKHRKKGLGKSIVYELCREIFHINKIPLYRCEVSLFSSLAVAQSLGFSPFKKTYHMEQDLKFK